MEAKEKNRIDESDIGIIGLRNSVVDTVYDTGPAGTIPATTGTGETTPFIPLDDRGSGNRIPYIRIEGKGKGKPRAGSDVGSDTADFSTSTTNRRGAGGRGSMFRYGLKYVQAMDRRYAPLTKEAMIRRYKRMDKDVDYLYKIGVINNLSPVSMTKEEVYNYLVYRMNLGVSDSEMDHEIAAMKSVFSYCGNKAMDEALAAYPNLKPKKHSGRLPTMSYDLVNRIMDCAMAVDPSDWKKMRAYAIPIWAIATGMRAKELTLCDIDDINVTGTMWTAKVMHPKGEGSYGKPRVTIVDPQMYPFLLSYFKCRAEYVADHGLTTRALFPGGNSEGGYMQGNTVRNQKKIASEEVGVDFDLRICRRTFGQRLIDAGVSIEVVSKLMGHKNTVTTENCYCSMSNGYAVDQVAAMFGNRAALNGGFGATMQNPLSGISGFR